MDQTPDNLLLTGPPRCGKTTVVRRVIAQLRDVRLAGFYTQDAATDDVAISRLSYASCSWRFYSVFSLFSSRCFPSRTADDAGVRIITGDTKVVDRGRGDGIYINTAGIGLVGPETDIRPGCVEPGDAVLVSGDLGRHGIAVMSVREGLEFAGAPESDCAPLHELVEALLAAGSELHCLRDLTRGGLAAALNEIARHTGLGIDFDEAAIPVSDGVRGACELLGLDPLFVANEGRLVAFCPAEAAEEVLRLMAAYPGAESPAVVGLVVEEHPGIVELQSPFGGGRILDLLSGEQMPRIC